MVISLPMTEDSQSIDRGWYLPISLITLYEKGIINAEDLMLLGKINSLCHPKKGCWATNSYLARWWKKTPDWVSSRISRFQKLGLIEVNGDGKNRVIWAAFQPEIEKILLKDSPKKSKSTWKKTSMEPGSFLPGQYCTKRVQYPLPSRFARVERGCGGDLQVNGEDQFVIQCTKSLETYVRRYHKIHPKFRREGWYHEFHLLLHSLGGDKARLKKVLMAYVGHPHGEYRPLALSAYAFRLKFPQIESWCQRCSLLVTNSQVKEEWMWVGGEKIKVRRAVSGEDSK